MADRKCYGYDCTADGLLVIHQEKSTIVKWIFESYRDGTSLWHIANDLAKRDTPSPTGKGKWRPCRLAFRPLGHTRKHAGHHLPRRGFSPDFDLTRCWKILSIPLTYILYCDKLYLVKYILSLEV